MHIAPCPHLNVPFGIGEHSLQLFLIYAIISDRTFIVTLGKIKAMAHFNQEGTVVVRTYNNIAEALAAKELLEESGIRAIVEDLDVMGLTPLAGIKIKVFSGDLEKARQLLQPS